MLNPRYRHALPDYADGMIDNALVFLSLFWFAVQPIADLADAPIVALIAFSTNSSLRWLEIDT